MCLILSITLLSTFLTVFSDECVSYNFEENLDELFSNTRSCSSFPLWNSGFYDSTSVPPPHESSVAYLTPNPSTSCVSSMPFIFDLAGTLEVSVFMKSVNLADQIVVLVHMVNNGGTDLVVAQGGLASTDGAFVVTNGFQNIEIESTGFPVTGEFEAYLVFMGTAGQDSTVIIDSFRYLPPGLEEALCPIYEILESRTTVVPEFATEADSDVGELYTSPINVYPTLPGMTIEATVTESTEPTTLTTDEIFTTSTVTEGSDEQTVTDSSVFTTLEIDTETTEPNVETTTENIDEENPDGESGENVTDATIPSTTNSNNINTETPVSTTVSISEQTTVTDTEETFTTNTDFNTLETSTASEYITSTIYITEATNEITDSNELTTTTNEFTPEITSVTFMTTEPVDFTTAENGDTGMPSTLDSSDISTTEVDVSTTVTEPLTEFTVSTIYPDTEENTIYPTILNTDPTTVTELSTVTDETDLTEGSINPDLEENISSSTIGNGESDTTITESTSTINPEEENTFGPSTESGDIDSTVTESSTYITDTNMPTSTVSSNTESNVVNPTTDNGENGLTVTESTISITTDDNNNGMLTQSTVEYVTDETIFTTDPDDSSLITENESTVTDDTVPITESTLIYTEYTTELIAITTENDLGIVSTDDNYTESDSTIDYETDNTTPIAIEPTEIPEESDTADSISGFWNPLTIVTVVLLNLIFLSLIFWCFYACGRKHGKLPPYLTANESYYNLPKPIVMPRAKRAINRMFL